MLQPDEVDLLCRVGKGTPAGEVFRRYWTPVLPSTDLPEPDGDPQRVTILGERLLAFRDSTGTVGLIDESCPHRGASLAIARVEHCGIRCLYHGWKFATDGSIQETPNMPAWSKFNELNRILSYPVREAGGIIWAYLGPPEKQPPFPEYFWFHARPEDVTISDFSMDCNYLQVQEGSIDSSHLSVLHMGMKLRWALEPDPEIAAMGGVVRFEGWPGQTMPPGSYIDNIPSNDMSPDFEVQDTDFGFQYAAIRNSIYDRRYVRITTVIFPYMAFIPPKNSAVICVPLDDHTTAFMGVHVAFPPVSGTAAPGSGSAAPVTGAAPGSGSAAPGSGSAAPGSRSAAPGSGSAAPGSAAAGRSSFAGATRAERHIAGLPDQDRRAMKEGRSFSGYANGRLEDVAVQVSMGPMFDRHNEHLVSPADAGIVRYRQLLRRQIRRMEEGFDPQFRDAGIDTAKIEAGSGLLPPGAPWSELVPGNRVVR